MTESTKSRRDTTTGRARSSVSASIPAWRDVKADAARKGLSLKNLFKEIWQTYKKHGGGKA